MKHVKWLTHTSIAAKRIQRTTTKFLSRSQKAPLPRNQKLINRSCLNVKIVFPLHTRVVKLIVCSMLIFMYTLFLRNSAFFTSFQACFCVSLVQFRVASENFMYWRKRQKKMWVICSVSQLVCIFSLLLDDFTLFIARVFKVKIVFFLSERALFHYYSFFVVACWLLFSFRGTYIKLCVLYTSELEFFFSKKYFSTFHSVFKFCPWMPRFIRSLAHFSVFIIFAM